MNRRQSVDTIADKWEVYLALTAVVLGGARPADGNPIVSYLPGHSSSQPSWLHCVYCTSEMTDKYFGFVACRCGSSQHAARPRMGLSMSTMDAFQCWCGAQVNYFIRCMTIWKIRGMLMHACGKFCNNHPTPHNPKLRCSAYCMKLPSDRHQWLFIAEI